MYKLIFFLVLTLIIIRIEAQTTYENFMSRSGAVIEKELIFIGKIEPKHKLLDTEIKVQLLKLSILGVDSSFFYVRFEFTRPSDQINPTKIGSINEVEVPEVLSFLRYLDDKFQQPFPENYTELFYMSQDGLEIGAFTDKKDWVLFFDLDKYDNKSNVSVDRTNISSIFQTLTLANTQILKSRKK